MITVERYMKSPPKSPSGRSGNSAITVKIQSEMPVLITRDFIELRELPVHSKKAHMGNGAEPNY